MYFVISMRFLNCLCNPRQRIFSAVSTVLQSGRKENAIFKLLIFFNREEKSCAFLLVSCLAVMVPIVLLDQQCCLQERVDTEAPGNTVVEK